MSSSSSGPVALDAAFAYKRLGFQPVPVPYGKKGPIIDGWQHLRFDYFELPKHFNGRGNIGLILGTPSDDLTDVDLDCPEALELADQYLPQTNVETGRKSTRRSHRWYLAPGAESKQFRDPVTDEMIVELRSTGLQTLVGPSIHPEGEQYDYLDGVPPTVDAADLLRRVEALYRAVLARRYPNGVPAKARAKKSTKPRAVSASVVNGTSADHWLAPAIEDSRVDSGDLRRAIAYVGATPEAVSGEGGHNQTYAVAVALVHGFCLPPDLALRVLMKHYNPRCKPPWTQAELEHKVSDAATKPHDKPRGWLRDAKPGDADPFEHLGDRDPESGRRILSPKRTLPTARAYIADFHDHHECPRLVCFGGELYEWRNNRYQPLEEGAVHNRLQSWLHEAVRPHQLANGTVVLLPFDSNATTIGHALAAVRDFTHLAAETPNPSWRIDDGVRLPPLELLPCRTNNLHLPTRELIPATPAFFTTNALDVDFDPDAPSPVHWFAFLEQLFGDDTESIELLQEWFGYALTADTSQQKALLIVGPPRSGKGTIARVLGRLIGTSNVCGPTVAGLASHFGLQPLLGKSLAIVSDARFSGEGVATVIERVLCITGEDLVTIDRKYLSPVDMRLPTRFVFLTNEFPRLTDSSTAIANRFLVLRLTESFLGREDHQLSARLYGELPGILNWAIEGWDRLRSRGHFVQPESSADAISKLVELASPVKAFVAECCDVREGVREYVDALYEAWRDWCHRDGRVIVTSKSTFGKDLAAAFPKVRWRRDTRQTPFYDGIALVGHPRVRP